MSMDTNSTDSRPFDIFKQYLKGRYRKIKDQYVFFQEEKSNNFYYYRMSR